MATLFQLDDFIDGYVDLVAQVKLHGERVSPRGMPTRELRNAVIELKNPTMASPVGVGRALPTKIIAAETLQFLAGVSDLVQLDAVSGGRFSEFSDDGVKLAGAYGPRIYNQLEGVVSTLTRDQDTRQAGVTIWRGYELEQVSRDVPCTVSFFFDIRDGRLNMTTFMRSSDVWRGMAIDVPVFTRLQLAIAWTLDMEVGEYVHHSRSLHLYEDDLDVTSALHWAESPLPLAPPDVTEGLLPFGHPAMRWDMLRRAAFKAQHEPAIDPGDFAPGLAWYRGKLAGHETGDKFCPQCRYWMPTDHVDSCVFL